MQLQQAQQILPDSVLEIVGIYEFFADHIQLLKGIGMLRVRDISYVLHRCRQISPLKCCMYSFTGKRMHHRLKRTDRICQYVAWLAWQQEVLARVDTHRYILRS